MTLLLLRLLSACVHPAVNTVPVEAVVVAAEPGALLALEAGAADLDVGVRRRAISALIRIDPLSGGGPWPARARFDPSEYVRRSAVDALRLRLDEPASRDVLRAWVGDLALDPWTAGAAAIGLAVGAKDGTIPAGERDADRALLVHRASQTSGNRSAAVLLAAARVGDKAAEARLATILESGNVPSELWFLRELGQSGLAALATVDLTSVEPEIRVPVAVAMYQLGAPSGRTALTDALSESEDSAIEVMESLLEARGPASDPLLLMGGAGVAADISRIVQFGLGAGDLQDVLRGLTSSDVDVQTFAARAAGMRLRAEGRFEGAERLRSALRLALPEANPAVELALIQGLAGSQLGPDRVALLGLLTDESALVRVEAAAALTAR